MLPRLAHEFFENFCTQFCHYHRVLLNEQSTCKMNPTSTLLYDVRSRITIRMCVADTAAFHDHPLHDASSVCNTYCTEDINTVFVLVRLRGLNHVVLC